MAKKKGKTWGDLVREYFPQASDDEVEYILWTHTGYPCFWIGTAEDCCRRQLQELKDKRGIGG